MEPTQFSFDTCQNIYRTLPRAVIAKPYAVPILNALLRSYESGIISEETFGEQTLKQIQAGSMLSSWESVRVEFTGRREGFCVEIEMYDRDGRIDGQYWIWEGHIIQQRSA